MHFNLLFSLNSHVYSIVNQSTIAIGLVDEEKSIEKG